MNAQFINVHERLDGIHEQTTKTNGGLSKAEEDIAVLKMENIKHVIDCPAMPKIDAINDSLIEYKWFKLHPKLGLAIVALASSLIIFNVFGILEKNQVAKKLINFNKEQVDDRKVLLMTIDSLKTIVETNKK
jgi:hypothetical protein